MRPSNKNKTTCCHDSEIPTKRQQGGNKPTRGSQVSNTSNSSGDQDREVSALTCELNRRHQSPMKSNRDGRNSLFLPQNKSLGENQTRRSVRFSLRLGGGGGKTAVPAPSPASPTYVAEPTASDSAGRTDVTVPAPASAPAILKGLQLKAHAILQHLRSSTEAMTRQVDDLEQSMEVHKDRATARFISQNRVGAVLSMKNFKRLELLHQRVMDAIDTLEMQDIELSAFVLKLEALATSANQGDASPQPQASYSQLTIELANYYTCLTKAEKTIAGEEVSHWDDEVLLKELSHMTKVV